MDGLYIWPERSDTSMEAVESQMDYSTDSLGILVSVASIASSQSIDAANGDATLEMTAQNGLYTGAGQPDTDSHTLLFDTSEWLFPGTPQHRDATPDLDTSCSSPSSPQSPFLGTPHHADDLLPDPFAFSPTSCACGDIGFHFLGCPASIESDPFGPCLISPPDNLFDTSIDVDGATLSPELPRSLLPTSPDALAETLLYYYAHTLIDAFDRLSSLASWRSHLPGPLRKHLKRLVDNASEILNIFDETLRAGGVENVWAGHETWWWRNSEGGSLHAKYGEKLIELRLGWKDKQQYWRRRALEACVRLASGSRLETIYDACGLPPSFALEMAVADVRDAARGVAQQALAFGMLPRGPTLPRHEVRRLNRMLRDRRTLPGECGGMRLYERVLWKKRKEEMRARGAVMDPVTAQHPFAVVARKASPVLESGTSARTDKTSLPSQDPDVSMKSSSSSLAGALGALAASPRFGETSLPSSPIARPSTPLPRFGQISFGTPAPSPKQGAAALDSLPSSDGKPALSSAFELANPFAAYSQKVPAQNDIIVGSAFTRFLGAFSSPSTAEQPEAGPSSASSNGDTPESMDEPPRDDSPERSPSPVACAVRRQRRRQRDQRPREHTGLTPPRYDGKAMGKARQVAAAAPDGPGGDSDDDEDKDEDDFWTGKENGRDGKSDKEPDREDDGDADASDDRNAPMSPDAGLLLNGVAASEEAEPDWPIIQFEPGSGRKRGIDPDAQDAESIPKDYRLPPAPSLALPRACFLPGTRRLRPHWERWVSEEWIHVARVEVQTFYAALIGGARGAREAAEGALGEAVLAADALGETEAEARELVEMLDGLAGAEAGVAAFVEGRAGEYRAWFERAKAKRVDPTKVLEEDTDDTGSEEDEGEREGEAEGPAFGKRKRTATLREPHEEEPAEGYFGLPPKRSAKRVRLASDEEEPAQIPRVVVRRSLRRQDGSTAPVRG